MKDKYYEAALKFCQEHGYEGDELPTYEAVKPGENWGISEHCPITIAFRPLEAKSSAVGTVMGKEYETIAQGGLDVCTFQDRADADCYPELMKERYSKSTGD